MLDIKVLLEGSNSCICRNDPPSLVAVEVWNSGCVNAESEERRTSAAGFAGLTDIQHEMSSVCECGGLCMEWLLDGCGTEWALIE